MQIESGLINRLINRYKTALLLRCGFFVPILFFDKSCPLDVTFFVFYKN